MTTRNILSEASQVLARAKFTTGGTITITIYLNAGGSAESLTSNAAVEQDSSGIYLWLFSNLTTAPIAYSDYLWIMTNGTPAEDQWGVERFGGWPDTVDSNVGANSVTITIEETDTTAIAGVEVQLLNVAESVVLDRKTTDASGQVVFSADNGSYKVILTKPQVTFSVSEDLTVLGTTTQTYNGTLLVIASVAGAGECEITMNVSSQRPTIPLTTLSGTAQIKVLPTLLSSVYYSGQKIEGSFDSTNKRLFFVLPQGAIVEFSIPETLGTTKVSKLIPATSTANFQDLEAR